MKRFNEYRTEVGPLPLYPTENFKYLAYKNGEYREFSTNTEATAFSNLVEKVCINSDEYKKLLQEYHEYHQKVFGLWYEDLRQEFHFLSDDMFDLIYAESYDRNHADSHDAVADGMKSVWNFAERVMKHCTKIGW